jgi:hypothetical protein
MMFQLLKCVFEIKGLEKRLVTEFSAKHWTVSVINLVVKRFETTDCDEYSGGSCRKHREQVVT